ncbi:MAG TPA: cytochrome C oxidase subunit IV family protein [bacterium]|jgi:cytochrome c oxidase subunit 4
MSDPSLAPPLEIHDPDRDDHGVAHITPVDLLFKVFLALVALTILTWWTSGLDLGGYDVVVALAIATIKASIVALYFMHLLWGEKVYAYAFISALICLLIFIVGANLDVFELRGTMIMDYAPEISQDFSADTSTEQPVQESE